MEPLTDKQRKRDKKIGERLDKSVMRNMFGNAWNLEQFGLLNDDGIYAKSFEKVGACVNNNNETVELTWEESKRLLIHVSVINGERELARRVLDSMHKREHDNVWKKKYLALLKGMGR